MSVRSVLVAGGSTAGCVAAIALAQLGAEVALMAHDSQLPADDATDLQDPAVLGALGVSTAGGNDDAGATSIVALLRRTLADLGVEVRTGIELLGVIDVDSHVEAELSNGRVENYDAVVIADGDTATRLEIGALTASERVPTATDAAQALRIAVCIGGGHEISGT